jgi:voltage-gated sodium channel
MKSLLKELKQHNHTWLDTFILGVIIFSAILIGLETDREIAAQWGWLFHTLDIFILWIFVCEVIIKIIAQGRQPWQYFRNAWNLFDFFIVLVGFVPLVVHYLHPESGTDLHAVAALRLIRIARAMRVMRVFRLITHLHDLQVLIETLFSSIRKLFYVGILLVCLFYMYSVVGVFLFRDNDAAHFGSLQLAHMTLFQCITGDGWSDVMNKEVVQTPGAESAHFESYPVIAPLYFGSFIVIGSYVLLNLVVGIIVSAMEKANLKHDESITKEFLEGEKLQSEVLDDILHRLMRIEAEMKRKNGS